MKTCTACNETKPLAEFHWVLRPNGQRDKHSKCQVCRRAQFKVWASSPRGKRVKRAGILRRDYRLTEAQYDSMLAAQSGVCSICEQPEIRRHRNGTMFRLSVDHDHKTGEPRSLLCSACNVGLGSFRDNAALLLAAAQYLLGQAARAEAAEKSAG